VNKVAYKYFWNPKPNALLNMLLFC
jgi:hypothetical protein